MLSYDEAIAIIREQSAQPGIEVLTLERARGRVLAEPVCLEEDQPGFDRATMDGYAVALAPDRSTFRLIGTVHAGEHQVFRPQPGEAVRIMTGAPCPPGTTVVPIEATDGGPETVTVNEERALTPGRNIAWRGEDGRAGARVAATGQRLNPVMIAAAAMAGAVAVQVFRPPRVGVITTGDEVGGEGPAGIRDSNGPLLVTLLEGIGCRVCRRHARDELSGLKRSLEEAQAESDVLVTVGGVSMGTRDLVPRAAEELGYRQIFHKVAMQPGKPVLLSRHDTGRYLVGLPGNPVSVLATSHLILAPLLGRFLGGWEPDWLHLPLGRDFHNPGQRRLFLPALLGDGGVIPTPWNGSGDLLAAAASGGLLDCVPGAKLCAGACIPFMPYLAARPTEHGLLPPRSPR